MRAAHTRTLAPSRVPANYRRVPASTRERAGTNAGWIQAPLHAWLGGGDSLYPLTTRLYPPVHGRLRVPGERVHGERGCTASVGIRYAGVGGRVGQMVRAAARYASCAPRTSRIESPANLSRNARATSNATAFSITTLAAATALTSLRS